MAFWGERYVCVYIYICMYIYIYIIYIHVWSPPYDTQTPSKHRKDQCETCFGDGRTSARFRMQHSYKIARQEKHKIPESKHQAPRIHPNWFARFRRCEKFWILGCLDFCFIFLGSWVFGFFLIFGFLDFLMFWICGVLSLFDICIVFCSGFLFCFFLVLCFGYTFVVSNVFLRAPKTELDFRCTEKAEFPDYY